MNKAQISRALKDGVEVAVYCDSDSNGYSGGAKPTDLFRYAADDYKRVVRCKLIAAGQRRVEHSRRAGGSPNPTLSHEADYIRVLPLDPLPEFGPNYPGRLHTPGVKPPHPEFDPAEGRVYGKDGEYLTTSRMIVATWDEFEQQKAAHEARKAAEQAARDAEAEARKAGLDAAADVATKLDALGFPVSVEINRPGVVVVSVEVAEQIAAAVAEQAATIDQLNGDLDETSEYL